jgi:hypothetical protein
MSWNVPRGRYGADALELQEIQKLQAAPESASHHIAQSCNACRCAAREQRATLEPILRDLLHVALAHGHAITLRPELDSYDVTIEIHPDRVGDSDDRGRSSRQAVSPVAIAMSRTR